MIGDLFSNGHFQIEFEFTRGNKVGCEQLCSMLIPNACNDQQVQMTVEYNVMSCFAQTNMG